MTYSLIGLHPGLLDLHEPEARAGPVEVVPPHALGLDVLLVADGDLLGHHAGAHPVAGPVVHVQAELDERALAVGHPAEADGPARPTVSSRPRGHRR